MNIVLPIVGFFLLGFVARRFIVNTSATVTWVNKFIIYIALPSLILLKIPQLEFSSQVILPAGIAWAWMLLGSGAVLLLSRWQGWPRPTEGAMLILVVLGNTSFLGYPMILAFFNDTVLGYAIFFDQLGNFLIFSTFGLIMVAVYSPANSQGATSVGVTRFAKQVFGFPPFIALLVALVLPINTGVELVSGGLNLIAMLLMPASLFVLGLQFQPTLLPEHKVPLVSAIALKMIVAPIFAFILLGAIGSSTDVRAATIFEMAMPCMVTPGLIAINAGIAPRFIATLLGYSTVFAFAWLPVVAWLLN